MKSKKRWRLIADMKIQGGLIARLLIYWVFFQIVHGGTDAVFGFVTNGAATNSSLWTPGLFASLLVVPICMFDMVCFSNRFVGPVLNLRRGLKNLASGSEEAVVRFRQGDFYTELAEDFELVKKQINELNDSAPETKTEAEIIHV